MLGWFDSVASGRDSSAAKGQKCGFQSSGFFKRS